MNDRIHELAVYIANMAYQSQVYNQTFEHFGQRVELELRREIPKLIKEQDHKEIAEGLFWIGHNGRWHKTSDVVYSIEAYLKAELPKLAEEKTCRWTLSKTGLTWTAECTGGTYCSDWYGPIHQRFCGLCGGKILEEQDDET